MKEKKDIGSSYLKQLGMEPPGASKLLYFQFERRFGETLGRKMLSDLYRKIREYEENEKYLSEFYEMKNESLDKALLFNAGYQGDFYRQMCNWIIANHDVFGKTILDAGCECGIMSCFLAMAFPDSKITAVDKSPNAIKAAKELADRLEIDNITFLNADVTGLPGQKYDTVFSMRLLQENCDMDKVLSGYNLLKAEAADFAENIHDFAGKLSALVAEGGYLVSAERCDVDPVFLGWLFKLNELGLTPVPDCYRELICKEMENEGTVQVFVAKNEAPAAEEDVYYFWCLCQTMHAGQEEKSQYKGWYADMELQNSGKDLLDGFLLQDKTGKNLLTYSLWSHCEIPDVLLLYQAMGNERLLTVYAMSEKEDVAAQIREIKKEYEAAGTVAKGLTFEDGKLKIG